MTTTPRNLNASLVSNNIEWLSEIQNKIKEQAKLQIFESLDFEKRNLQDIKTTISKIETMEKDAKKSIGYKSGTITFDGLRTEAPYDKIFEKYKDVKDKELMYMEIAERITLDNWSTISYRDWDYIGKHKITKDFVKGEYDKLNSEYDNKLDLFTIKDKDWKLYLIKLRRTPEELEQIKEKEEQLKNEKLESLYKENKEHTKNAKENKAKIAELEKLLNSNKDTETDEKIDDEDTDLENKESAEKSEKFISRKYIEKSVQKMRKETWYPSGVIEIKWEKINVEEFEFYEEMKSEYIEAKWDEERLSELDKEFAEMVILFSPIWSEVKDRYTIKLDGEELEKWLYVSAERLARYGLAINPHDYYEKIIERDYKESLETIQRIETEITELTNIITELTRKITIEKSSHESIILEISEKRERVKILKERLYALLLSLRSSWNRWIDKDLLALKEKEQQLQKELDDLRKKKKHQEEVNKRVSELQEQIANLKNNNIDEKTIRKNVEHEFFKKLPVANRNQFASNISENKKQNWLDGKNIWIPWGEIEIRKDPLLKVNINLDSYWMTWDYENLVDEINNLKGSNNYKDKDKEIQKREKALRELDSMLAERIILDNWLAIEFKTSDEKNFESKRDARGERDYAFKKLSELKEYKWKLKKRKVGNNYYIFMITEEQQAKIDKEVEEKIKALSNWDNSEKIKALKDELMQLKQEQEWFDKDIDKKIADKEKELADIREQIKNREKGKRVVVERFVDDEQVRFYDFCKKNGIKRKDGKKIPETGGMDPDAVYIDKNGRELKLESDKWAHDYWYDNPIAYLELVYYEGWESMRTDDIEKELLIIIHEQETLEADLAKLEIKLREAETGGEKIKIEEEIKIIKEKLITISKEITKCVTVMRERKETVTERRYRIYSATPTEVIPTEGLQLNAVISDMWTDVFREKAALKVEEEIKRQYKSLWRWQMWSRLALFLWRWSKRKKMMKNEMNNMANTAFQTDAAYTTLNEQSQNAADRHEHELLTSMAAVNLIGHAHNTQIDQLCKDYLNDRETDASFQQKFNAIVAADANIQSILRGNNITHIWTNVLLQLKEQKALKVLIDNLDRELSAYIATHNTVNKDNMETYVGQYIKDYQKTPAFMAMFENFVNWDLNARNRLRAYLSHQKAIMKMQITNLTMNIDILNKWKSAYQIDNKDREKWWKYKVWHFLDKHPRGTAIGSAALAAWLWVVTAWTSAVVWAAISTWVFGSYVWFTNYIKKWTHHTKEQNTHEKNVVTDYRNEQAKIQNWQNTALTGRWWKKYKAKRQLALYDQTTQANIQLSSQISEYITNLSAKTWTLTSNEENFMKLNLIEWWARLKYYKAMWHNFLASERVDETEKDMRRLEKAITLWLSKIGKTTNDIENTMNATNTLGTNITYNVIQNDLKTSYDKSLIQFKRERRWLALRYGIWTAIASIGASLAVQKIFGSWIFSHDTPAYSASMSTSDYYALWKSNWLTGNIAADTNAALSSAPNWATVTIGYWAWTDGTPVIPWHLNLSELTWTGWKIETVKAYIDGLPTKLDGVPWPGLTATDKATFIAELNSMSAWSWTNWVLQSMRECNLLQQAAIWLSDSWKSWFVNIALTPDPALDVIWTTRYTAWDRVANAFIEITKDGVPWKKSWFFGVPLFFNTFKDRKSKKDTTDQDFGNNNQNWQQNP